MILQNLRHNLAKLIAPELVERFKAATLSALEISKLRQLKNEMTIIKECGCHCKKKKCANRLTLQRYG